MTWFIDPKTLALLILTLYLCWTASAWFLTRQPPLSHQKGQTTQLHAEQELLLDKCVCLVTGASRGIGRGIALELGTHGAIVYVTGTTTSTSPTHTDEELTIEKTAADVSAAGGQGIPVVCDHANDEDVKLLMERIEKEQGGALDILVNNAFRLPDAGPEALQRNFGNKTIQQRHGILSTPHGRRRPLIVMISSFGGLSYSFNVAYGVGKAGVDRLVKDLAVDLTGHNVSVVSLWPGLVDTERTKELVASGDWDKFVKIPLDNAESPQFTGRAVVALATDPNNMEKSGTYQVVAELAEEYGFTDVDGKQPPSIRSLRFLLPAYGLTEEQRRNIPPSLIPDWKLPFWVMARGRPPSE